MPGKYCVFLAVFNFVKKVRVSTVHHCSDRYSVYELSFSYSNETYVMKKKNVLRYP